MTRLDEIRERLSAATPGPWAVAERSGWDCDKTIAWEVAVCYGDEDVRHVHHAGDGLPESVIVNSVNNADLIANAPDDIQYLLQLIDTMNTCGISCCQVCEQYNECGSADVVAGSLLTVAEAKLAKDDGQQLPGEVR